MGFTSLHAQKHPPAKHEGLRLKNGAEHRWRRIRVLFVHRDAKEIERCVHALRKGQFVVKNDAVTTPAACSERLASQSYDVIVAEYGSTKNNGRRAWQFPDEVARATPLILLTSAKEFETIAKQGTHDMFEYVVGGNLAQLPMVIRGALRQKQLNEELAETERALRRSRSRYRALVENPSYGICRCDAEGKILEANQALLAMLGYEREEELFAANRAQGIVIDLGQGRPLDGLNAESRRFEPVDMEWKKRDGAILKTKLSGRDAFDERGNFNGCEIIAVDITEQRNVEELLRKQASTDSLTDLANHRRLFDVLQAEIARSRRTGREFSLILLDLDGLKSINDKYGHLGGDRALCRLAEILKDCCRNVDTAARHGGDEFAIVLPETSGSEAEMVAQRICEVLCGEAEEPALTVSVGIASFPGAGETIGALVCSADRELYAMKEKKQSAPAAHKTASTC